MGTKPHSPPKGKDSPSFGARDEDKPAAPGARPGVKSRVAAARERALKRADK